jgi:methylated-DNA-[protein]-cysteine S-methyltransferase
VRFQAPTDALSLSPSGAAYDAKLALPFAVIGIRATPTHVTGISYLPPDEPELAPRNATAALALRQLQRYVEDPEFRFTLPLACNGTPFRKHVWDAISAIPLRESRTYGEIARQVRSAARAVGQACGANPIALVIPCHRVVGSRGVLGGFMNASAGEAIAIKRWLLVHEGYRFGA